MEASTILRELPPIILHPFDGCPALISRPRTVHAEQRAKEHLQSRYDEFCMLCRIGNDLNRRLAQCDEVADGDPELSGMSERDFIAVLLFAPPIPVLKQMRRWGIENPQLLFSRAIGLNTVFTNPPPASDLSESFLREADRLADWLFDRRLNSEAPTATVEDRFTFEIYASDTEDDGPPVILGRLPVSSKTSTDGSAG